MLASYCAHRARRAIMASLCLTLQAGLASGRVGSRGRRGGESGRPFLAVDIRGSRSGGERAARQADGVRAAQVGQQFITARRTISDSDISTFVQLCGCAIPGDGTPLPLRLLWCCHASPQAPRPTHANAQCTMHYKRSSGARGHCHTSAPSPFVGESPRQAHRASAALRLSSRCTPLSL